MTRVLPTGEFAFEARDWSLGYRRLNMSSYARREPKAYLKEFFSKSKCNDSAKDPLDPRGARLAIERATAKTMGIALRLWRKRFGPCGSYGCADVEAVFRQTIKPNQIVRIIPFYERGKALKSRRQRNRFNKDDG